MKIIAHRGNLNGPDPATENTIEQAEKCFALGFDVELDIWHTDKGYFLGHDAPKEKVNWLWLDRNSDKIFAHAKDARTASVIIDDERVHCFFHESDPLTITSFGWVWYRVETKIFKPKGWKCGTVACLPELAPDWDISKATHICTDYPIKYQEKYMRTVSQ